MFNRNQGCLVGRSPSIGFFKTLNFSTVKARWNKFLEWVDIKNKLNVTNIGDATMGVSPKRALQNYNFLTFLARHMKFLR